MFYYSYKVAHQDLAANILQVLELAPRETIISQATFDFSHTRPAILLAGKGARAFPRDLINTDSGDLARRNIAKRTDHANVGKVVNALFMPAPVRSCGFRQLVQSSFFRLMFL